MTSAHHHFNLEKIFTNFSHQGTFESANPYGSGHINDTFLVTTLEPSSHNYILQRVNHNVFKNVPGQMDNIVRVTEHLKQKLRQIPGADPERETLTIIKTTDRQPYYQDAEGNYWRAYLFVDNCTTYNLVDSPEKAYQGGLAFGRFQCLLADLPGAPLFETIPDFHNIEKRLEKLEIAANLDSHKRKAAVSEELAFVRDLAEEMKILLNLSKQGKIPSRVTHNDTKFNNVLLDNTTNKGLCVIDLDTVMTGLLQYDFSDSIRTVTNTGEEDEKDLNKVMMNLDLFSAYAEGFLSQVKSTLTLTEIEQLSASASLLPYTIGVRFLTDYLEGDTYFKIHFPEHNIQRARVQFKLTQSIRAKLTQMREVIDRIMQK